MGCLVVLLAAVTPRFALILLWIFTNFVSRAFQGGWIMPLLGMLFLPFATVFYVLVYNPMAPTHVSMFGWLLVAMGFILDVSAYAGSKRARGSDRAR